MLSNGVRMDGWGEGPRFRRALLSEIDRIERSTLEALERLRGLIDPQRNTLEPRDPRNKSPDGKLTERGVEVCFRLFDEGKTPYAVSNAMRIAFGSAMNRFNGWTKAGGPNRKKRRLD